MSDRLRELERAVEEEPTSERALRALCAERRRRGDEWLPDVPRPDSWRAVHLAIQGIREFSVGGLILRDWDRMVREAMIRDFSSRHWSWAGELLRERGRGRLDPLTEAQAAADEIMLQPPLRPTADAIEALGIARPGPGRTRGVSAFNAIMGDLERMRRLMEIEGVRPGMIRLASIDELNEPPAP